MDGLLGRIVSDPGVGELLPPVDAVTAPTLLMKPLLQVTNFDSVTQAQIDTALDHVRATPELQPAANGAQLDDRNGHGWYADHGRHRPAARHRRRGR